MAWGGTRKGAGRPKSEKRKKVLSLRVTEKEEKLMKEYLLDIRKEDEITERELYLIDQAEWSTVSQIEKTLIERRHCDHNKGFLGRSLVQERVSKIINEEEVEELSVRTWIEDKKGNIIEEVK